MTCLHLQKNGSLIAIISFFFICSFKEGVNYSFYNALMEKTDDDDDELLHKERSIQRAKMSKLKRKDDLCNERKQLGHFCQLLILTEEIDRMRQKRPILH